MNKKSQVTQRLRKWTVFFMIALALSGISAMPAEAELNFLSRCFSPDSSIGAWLDRVYLGTADVGRRYPFIAYGYDWLAFAHIILALLFVGVWKDPVRNKWIVELGMIACMLVIPFAMIAGYFRDIPLWWRLIDCSFGLFGLLPLARCLYLIHQLEILDREEAKYEN